MHSSVVPPPSELCSAPFLASVLRRPLSRTSATRLSGGLSGECSRVALFALDGSPAGTVVIKTTAAGGGPTSAALGLAREAAFVGSPLWAQLQRALAPGSLPAVHFAAGDLANGRKALVLEDVGGVQAGRFFGNGSPLCWDAPPLSVEDTEDGATTAEGVTRAAFALAARWHAAFWADVTLLAAKPAWLRGAAALAGSGGADDDVGARAEWVAAQAHAARSWRATEAAIVAGTFGCTLPPRVRALVRASLRRASWEAYRGQCAERVQSGMFTLVHGDFHPHNCMWLPAPAAAARLEGPARLVVLDYEAVGLGSGPQDLAQARACVRACVRGAFLRGGGRCAGRRLRCLCPFPSPPPLPFIRSS